MPLVGSGVGGRGQCRCGALMVRWAGGGRKGGRSQGGELEQNLPQQVIAGCVGDGGQHGTDVPGRGLLAGALDPGRGRPHEPLRGQRFGALQRIEQDQGEALRQVRRELGADIADQVRAQQGEHHTGRALGFLRGVVLAAFLDVVEERCASQSHLGRHPISFSDSSWRVRRAG